MNIVEERMRARLQAFKEEMGKKKAEEALIPKVYAKPSKEQMRAYQEKYKALRKEIKLSRMSEEEAIVLAKQKIIGGDQAFVKFLRGWKKELKASLEDETLSEFQKWCKRLMIDKLTIAANDREKREEYKDFLFDSWRRSNNLNA